MTAISVGATTAESVALTDGFRLLRAGNILALGAMLALVPAPAQALDNKCGLVCKPGEFLDPVDCQCIDLHEFPAMEGCMLVCNKPGQSVDPFHCRCIDDGLLSDLLRKMSRSKSKK